MPLDSTIPQETPVVARQVGGRPLEAGSLLWQTLFPSDLLRIDGRVPTDKSAQFLLQTRMNSTKELIAVAFSPALGGANAGFQILTDFLIAKGCVSHHNLSKYTHAFLISVDTDSFFPGAPARKKLAPASNCTSYPYSPAILSQNTWSSSTTCASLPSARPTTSSASGCSTRASSRHLHHPLPPYLHLPQSPGHHTVPLLLLRR